MQLFEPLLSEGSDDGRALLGGPAVEVRDEEDGDLIALQALLVAVEFLVVLEEVDV